ncbi:glycosyltransferase family 1 protein [Actinospica durhamensis]|uniref:Glycosyltransferase family 1 protein n=1 Tax=Actinospica durhamensis TaxID=1508375 RepID=A0A941EUW8_9ACTN|nr:glycosyltransferase [Actinospica durhamensis]MBR7836898.1 glycosyltransferase family 1 protein [Actinospica durhamensis]
MRILFTFIGGSGHLRPLFPFAHAAQAAGHTVAVAGSGSQQDAIASAGFTALATSEPRPPKADQEEDPLTAPDPQREERTMREGFAGNGARRHARVVRKIALDWKPDVIVRDEVDFGTAIAAESLGIPCATVIVLLAGGLIRPDTVAEPLDALRAEYGLSPDPDLAKLHGDLVIMPGPPSLRDPRYALPAGTFWCRPDHAIPQAAGSGTSSTSGAGRRPRVYFTLGTIDTFRELFDKVLTAARTIPIDLTVTVGPRLDPASFGPQPDNVRIERFIPQDEILPTCDLVIAHGGSGTLIGALAHGLPSILFPLGADQPHNAERCVALGTARELDPMAFTPKDVADAILELTGEETGAPYHRAARAAQAEINALPGPNDALAMIERLVSSPGSHLIARDH